MQISGIIIVNFLCFVLCLNKSIPKYMPKAPPNKEKMNNVNSETLHFLCLALYLSIPHIMKEIIFIIDK